MMKENKNFNLQTLLSILMAAAMIIGVFETASGQYVIKQADSQAGLYNYARAVPLYEKAYKKRTTSAAARGVAESYRLMNDYAAAEPWYAKLVAMPDHTPADELHYARVLMSNGKYTEAKQVLDAFLGKDPAHAIAGNMRKGCDSAVKWLSAPVKGALENVQALNSPWCDWSTAFHNGTVIFASDRPYAPLHQKPSPGKSGINRKYYGWTGKNYLHLYEGNAQDSAATKMLGRNINGDYHSASASYNDSGKFYYAVTELLKKGSSFLGNEKPYTLNVQIKEQQWDSMTNGWKQSALFPYNEVFNYSVGDPYITPDGTTLYFVSNNGDNSMGGTDIYYSRLDESGKWQTPVNMGPEINTAGNERTPVFAKDGTFYFASDGRPGMGALDIYKAVKTGSGETWEVTNMRSPVNSAQDDFAPAFERAEAIYFSSNRPGGKGSDDIYRFKPTPVFTLSGTARDKKTGLPLANAEVMLVNKLTGATLKAITDDEGNYRFMLENDADYGLSVVKTGYIRETGVGITTKGLTVSGNLRNDVLLDKTQEEIVAPQPQPQPEIVLNQPVKLENVYFNLAKWDITPRAAKELDRLAKLLNDNATWKVEIATHTDSRSSDSYNLKLSQRRAESVVAYLIKKGIGAHRLVAKGYGETKLVNRCANGVRCTEKQHQENRRTEFTLLDK
jgi:outer membrane protein OmpA-like peptidoglycan-associated protein